MLFKTWISIFTSTELEKMLKPSPLLIEVRDEYIAYIVLQKIKKSQNPILIFGQEMTPERLENEFFGLSLFDLEGPRLILNAQDLLKNSLDLFTKRKKDIDWQQKKAIFFAAKHNPSLIKIFSHYHHLELPRFWEYNLLLNFFAKHFGLAMDNSAQQFFLDRVTQTTEHYFEACQRLTYEYPPSLTLSQEHLKKILTKKKLDHFTLSKHLGERRWQDFYHDLLQNELSYNELREVFVFLQFHVIKLMDPSYAENKKKTSQYDRQVQTQSKKWSQRELIQCLKKLARYEQLCKMKDSNLKNYLRTSSLKNS